MDVLSPSLLVVNPAVIISIIPLKERVLIHLLNQLDLKMDGAEVCEMFLAVKASAWP